MSHLSCVTMRQSAILNFEFWMLNYPILNFNAHMRCFEHKSHSNFFEPQDIFLTRITRITNIFWTRIIRITRIFFLAHGSHRSHGSANASHGSRISFWNPCESCYLPSVSGPTANLVCNHQEPKIREIRVQKYSFNSRYSCSKKSRVQMWAHRREQKSVRSVRSVCKKYSFNSDYSCSKKIRVRSVCQIKHSCHSSNSCSKKIRVKSVWSVRSVWKNIRVIRVIRVQKKLE